MHDGFGLNSGITIAGGDGALLVNGEAFAWRPWEASGKMKLVNEKGQFELPAEAFGLFDVLWPRPGMFSFVAGFRVCSFGRNRRNLCVCVQVKLMAWFYRSAGDWGGQDQLAAESSDETASYAAGDEGRDAGHEECGGAVQFAGDGARSVGCGGGFDTHWLGGRIRRCFMIVVRGVFGFGGVASVRVRYDLIGANRMNRAWLC